MSGNGRLTAPPEFKVVLVTNSVYGMMSEGRRSRPATGISTLASFSPKTRTREARYCSWAEGPGAGRIHGPEKVDPACAKDAFTTHASAAGVSKTQALSEPEEAAAGF
jgi:hypothetical protein